MPIEISESLRAERRAILLHIMEHGYISKPDINKVLRGQHADRWLLENKDLGLVEDADRNIKSLRRGSRRRQIALIPSIDTNGLGGIHAVRH